MRLFAEGAYVRTRAGFVNEAETEAGHHLLVFLTAIEVWP